MRGVLSLRCPQSSQLVEEEEGEGEVTVELGPPLEVAQVLLQEHLRTQAKNKNKTALFLNVSSFKCSNTGMLAHPCNALFTHICACIRQR